MTVVEGWFAGGKCRVPMPSALPPYVKKLTELNAALNSKAFLQVHVCVCVCVCACVHALAPMCARVRARMCVMGACFLSPGLLACWPVGLLACWPV